MGECIIKKCVCTVIVNKFPAAVKLKYNRSSSKLMSTGAVQRFVAYIDHYIIAYLRMDFAVNRCPTSIPIIARTRRYA